MQSVVPGEADQGVTVGLREGGQGSFLTEDGPPLRASRAELVVEPLCPAARGHSEFVADRENQVSVRPFVAVPVGL